MANQVAQNTWSSKYRSKNDRDPPDIYENLNVSLLGARPGEADPGHTYPRLPQEQDFPKYIENRIVASNAPKKDIQYVIVVLHGYAADIPALLEFSKKHLLGPRTACVLVRGTNTFQESDGTYCWSDNCDFIGGPGGKIRALQAKHRWLIKRRTGFSSIESFGIGGPSRSNTNDIRVKNPEDSIDDPERNDPLDDEDKEEDVSRPTFVSSTKQIGLEVITDVLVRKCGFKPRDIAIVGHDQGGSAALAVAAACWKTKFGGVVTIGGALPSDFPDLVDGVKSLTHVLLLGGKLGDIDNKEAARIGRVFAGTTLALKQDKSDDFDDIDEAALVGFLAHQLRREEWTKEAVITFDGGGIRGYGSLLMLRELMTKIARFERELDIGIEANGERLLSESSFSPCEYPPFVVNGKITPRPIHSLDDDERYLPCHYFTYAGGTSTGGLISIMISRFRMTVHDCIEEYKKMGRRVFGDPRPPGLGPIPTPWHKFDATDLEKVIQKVIECHGEKIEQTEDGVQYPSHEDLCKTIVAARANDTRAGQTSAFLFRTYDCREEDADDSRNSPLNAGPAARCSIVEVGRATSAAPNYFRPIHITNWGVTGYESGRIEFIDGGFGTNNPSHEILKDIKRKLKAPNEVFEVFASFGTGISGENLHGRLSSLNRMLKEMKKEMTNVLRAHEAMENDSGAHNVDGYRSFKYFRFDGGKDLGEIPMDEWSGRRKSQLKLSSRPTGEDTLGSMDRAVRDFLKRPEVRNGLEELAKILVNRRRLRTREREAWERYACDARYECSQAECREKLYTLDDFLPHLDSQHANLSEDDRSVSIQESKKCWTYRGLGDES